MLQKLITKMLKPALIEHYKKVYETYMNASIKNDNFELGQILECEYILIKFFNIDMKTLFDAQEVVRHGKKRSGNGVQNQN